jgi:hypothetical protein
MSEKQRNIQAAGEAIGLVSSLLDLHDWDWLHEQMQAADTLGPILDPTAYRDALYGGRLGRNQRTIAATRTYLAVLREVFEEQQTAAP